MLLSKAYKRYTRCASMGRRDLGQQIMSSGQQFAVAPPRSRSAAPASAAAGDGTLGTPADDDVVGLQTANAHCVSTSAPHFSAY